MTVYYFAPVDPYTAQSGGTRKLADHVEILKAHGFDAQVIVGMEPPEYYKPHDVVVVPEVYGEFLVDCAPAHIRRFAFVQNGYLIDTFRCPPDQPHPFVRAPRLHAVLTESDHSTELVKIRCPDLQAPIIRTHPCGNAERGVSRGLSFGPWPRRKVVSYFAYKHEAQNEAILGNLDLPEGWTTEQLQGTDEQVRVGMQTSAIFAAPNSNEGMCAPTCEAMICGAVTVGWPGGPSKTFPHHPTPDWSWQILEGDSFAGGPMEYLITGNLHRAVIVPQDDVAALRDAICVTARHIDAYPEDVAQRTLANSEYFQRTYNRELEVNELVEIMGAL